MTSSEVFSLVHEKKNHSLLWEMNWSNDFGGQVGCFLQNGTDRHVWCLHKGAGNYKTLCVDISSDFHVIFFNGPWKSSTLDWTLSTICHDLPFVLWPLGVLGPRERTWRPCSFLGSKQWHKPDRLKVSRRGTKQEYHFVNVRYKYLYEPYMSGFISHLMKLMNRCSGN